MTRLTKAILIGTVSCDFHNESFVSEARAESFVSQFMAFVEDVAVGNRSIDIEGRFYILDHRKVWRDIDFGGNRGAHIIADNPFGWFRGRRISEDGSIHGPDKEVIIDNHVVEASKDTSIPT